MKRESTGRIAMGLATGTVFGFLLHKGRAADSCAIPGQLLLKDSSVVKIMGTASAAGALGCRILSRYGVADPKIKPLNPAGVAVGGSLFGAGMALLGYCPGTNMAALGAGHRDAAAGAVGMLAGALAFVGLYPRMKPLIEKGSQGKVTLPQMTGTPPWLWTAGLLLGAAALRRRAH